MTPQQIAEALAAVMSDDAKKAFKAIFESGNMDAAKGLVKMQAQRHVTEQMIIGSHAATSPAMQNGLSEIAYDLLKDGKKLAINELGEVERVPA